MELKFNVDGGISKVEVANDCYVDELFAALKEVPASVSDDELHEMMRKSNLGMISPETGVAIQFKNYANSDSQISDLGINGNTVYTLSEGVVRASKNG